MPIGYDRLCVSCMSSSAPTSKFQKKFKKYKFFSRSHRVWGNFIQRVHPVK